MQIRLMKLDRSPDRLAEFKSFNFQRRLSLEYLVGGRAIGR
jgi:hypothetical protein